MNKQAAAAALAAAMLASSPVHADTMPAGYERLGWLMPEFSLPVLRDDPRAPDRLQVFASADLLHWTRFAVADVAIAPQPRVRSVWVSDASPITDNPMLDGEDTRAVTRDEALALMDAVATTAARPPNRDMICLHGPTYQYVMRRDGVVTSGALDWCSFDDVTPLVRRIITGSEAPGMRPVHISR